MSPGGTDAAQLLADVRGALRVLWVAGVRRPDPTLPSQLADLAHAADHLGWQALGQPLRALADEARHALTDPRADRSEALFVAQRRVWVRVWMLSRRLAAHRISVALEQAAAGTVPQAPPPPTGRTTTLWPLGVQQGEGRWQLHALDPDGRWVTLEDRPLATDPDDPFTGPTTSRLFHDDVRLASVLTGEIELRDHPGTSTRMRWVGRPAFHTRPRLRVARRAAPALPELPPRAEEGVGWRTLTFRHTPAGWVGRSQAQAVPVAPRLAFDLDKRALGRRSEPLALRGTAVADGDELVVLSLGEPPAFPTLDPRTSRWPLSAWVHPDATGRQQARQVQLQALAWPALGGDRGALATALAPQLRTPVDLAQRWAAQLAARAIGLPGPDRCTAADQVLAHPDGPADALLQALWLATDADRPLEAAALALLEARDGPVDPDDTLEIVLRGWAMLLAGDDGGAAFLDAHAARWRDAEVLPSAEGLLWIGELWAVAHHAGAPVASLGLGRWRQAQAVMAALRRAAGRCTEEAGHAWRLADRAGVLGWFLRAPTEPGAGTR